MQALRVSKWGDLSDLQVDEVPRPAPGPGEVLVRMAYGGINFMDVYTVRGAYKASRTYPTLLPLTTGVEGSGVVDALGDGVTEWALGDRVCFCLHWGAHADWAVVPAVKLGHVPGGISLQAAAGVTFQGCTAHYLANDIARLESEQWALVYSGAGGVGQLLIQMLRCRGVRVIAVASSEAKEEVARARGAEVVLRPDEPTFVHQVRTASKGGVHVAYDSYGRETINQSLQSLRTRGHLVLVGTNSGPVTSLDVASFAEGGSLSFVRPRLADFIATRAELNARLDELFGMIMEGRLHVALEQVCALDDVPLRLQALADRTAVGKSIVRLQTA